MKRKELLSILCQNQILDTIKNGPVAILMSSGGKQISIIVSQKNNNVSASVGRFFKRKYIFHPEELRTT